VLVRGNRGGYRGGVVVVVTVSFMMAALLLAVVAAVIRWHGFEQQENLLENNHITKFGIYSYSITIKFS